MKDPLNLGNLTDAALEVLRQLVDQADAEALVVTAVEVDQYEALRKGTVIVRWRLPDPATEGRKGSA